LAFDRAGDDHVVQVFKQYARFSIFLSGQIKSTFFMQSFQLEMGGWVLKFSGSFPTKLLFLMK